METNKNKKKDAALETANKREGLADLVFLYLKSDLERPLNHNLHRTIKTERIWYNATKLAYWCLLNHNGRQFRIYEQQYKDRIEEMEAKREDKLAELEKQEETASKASEGGGHA